MAVSGVFPPRAETEEVEDHAEVEFSAPCGGCWKGVDYVLERMPQKIREDDENPVTTDEESGLSVLS